MPDETMAGVSDDPSDAIGAAINAASGVSATSPFAGQRLTIDNHADVATADYARQASDFARQASDQVRRASEETTQPSVFDPNTVLALADNAAEKAELAISAYQALARATDTQFRHVRRSARLAWASVAVMAAGVAVAVGWTSHFLTKAQMQTQYLREQVSQTSAAVQLTSAEKNELQAELSAARQQAARAEGQVTALSDTQAKLEARMDARQASSVSPSATQPTTRPSTFVDRLTFLLSDKGE
jgi:flagellar biosynthesis chaperone FliJ